MARSIYLVNPTFDSPSYFSTELLRDTTGRPATFMSLAIPTVAAMIPDDFEITVCDENVAPIDFDSPADFVGITGMVSQFARMKEIARKFRARGKVVLIGGPHASLRPEVVRPHCDILVRGEIEDIAGELFDDLRAGSWKSEYVGTRADLVNSPLPRLDLYPNDRALAGAIQTSRGCPFACDFCDVIQYQGRKQRHKSIPQVLRELDQLHAAGYTFVLITDDNLTAARKRVRKLLTAIRDWNAQKERRLSFFAQISIDAASDDELLRLCAEAGIERVFVGIETPNKESLREVGKNQNVQSDPLSQIERFVEHGMVVLGGMIVGFDSDDPDIFLRQYEFAMSTPVPIFTAAALFAPASTPLHGRLSREGRVIPENVDLAWGPWNTNVIPKRMTQEELMTGLKWLCNKLYSPRAFAERVRRLAELQVNGTRTRRPDPPKSRPSIRPVERECLALLKRLPRLGFAEIRMAGKMLRLALRDPKVAPVLIYHLLTYLQIRHMLDRNGMWDPTLAKRDEPWPGLKAA